MNSLAQLERRVQALEGARQRPQRLDLPMSVQKFVSSGKRVVRGVASLRHVDLQGDLVEPKGGKWTLPLPFLAQHRHEDVIGVVREVTATADGITIAAEVAEGIEQADRYWALIERGLVASLSIGFMGQQWEPTPTGKRFTAWTLLEVSAVTIGACPGARITGTKAHRDGIKLVRGGIPLVQS